MFNLSTSKMLSIIENIKSGDAFVVMDERKASMELCSFIVMALSFCFNRFGMFVTDNGSGRIVGAINALGDTICDS